MITLPSDLADATLASHEAWDALRAAYATGDSELIRRKRDAWIRAAERRHALMPPPSSERAAAIL